MDHLTNDGLKCVPQYQLGPLQRVFVRDLVLVTSIGVHAHEMLAKQRIRVSVDLLVQLDGLVDDRLKDTICYDKICSQIRELTEGEHVRLVETFADRVVAICFVDERVKEISVTVEKLDVYNDVASVGVTLMASRVHEQSSG